MKAMLTAWGHPICEVDITYEPREGVPESIYMVRLPDGEMGVAAADTKELVNRINIKLEEVKS